MFDNGGAAALPDNSALGEVCDPASAAYFLWRSTLPMASRRAAPSVRPGASQPPSSNSFQA
jgi:hypothetical protein